MMLMTIWHNEEAKLKKNTGNFISSVETALFILCLILCFIVMKHINDYLIIHAIQKIPLACIYSNTKNNFMFSV